MSISICVKAQQYKAWLFDPGRTHHLSKIYLSTHQLIQGVKVRRHRNISRNLLNFRWVSDLNPLYKDPKLKMSSSGDVMMWCRSQKCDCTKRIFNILNYISRGSKERQYRAKKLCQNFLQPELQFQGTSLHNYNVFFPH